MPRGTTRDYQATTERKFVDPRSFLSTDGHEYLAGRDMQRRRQEVIKAAKGRCAMCGEYRNALFGEVDHIVKRGLGGCDCFEPEGCVNVRWLCAQCHRRRHGNGNRAGKQQMLELELRGHTQ